MKTLVKMGHSNRGLTVPDCPECQWLRYKVDIAAALSVKTARRVLELNEDSAECSVAVVAMRRARATLEGCELNYDAHIAGHTHIAGLVSPAFRRHVMSGLD